MTIEIIEEVMPGTSVIEEIVNLQLSVIEGDTAAAEAAAAAAAASAASASSSASTATTQAGIATTKAQEADASATAAETARTGAETAETNAETAQAAAEAARDEITDKIDFTGIQVGDLLQAVDVSGDVKLVRVEPVELLKSTGPFLKSPLAGMVDLDNLFAWDGFNRSNGAIGMADSGQTWQGLGLVPQLVVFDKNVQTATNSTLSISVIERINFGSQGFSRGSCSVYVNLFDGGTGGPINGIIFAINQNNYIRVTKGTVTQIRVSVFILGVETIVSDSVAGVESDTFYIHAKFIRRQLSNNIYVDIVSDIIPSPYRVNLSAYFSTFGAEINTIRYVGLINDSVGRNIRSFLAINNSR